jgi:arginase family enzyme
MPPATSAKLEASGVTYLLVPYDAGSRRGGVSESLESWISITKDASRRVHLERDSAEVLPLRLGRRVRSVMAADRVPLTLGGDHTLTWYALGAAIELAGPLTVVHFDAHHDAYDSNILNHYTVFHHIKRLLPVKVKPVGHRYECSPVAPALEEDITGPIYLTVDVDYFCPDLVGGVGHAVPCAEVGHCDLDTFSRSLRRMKGPIIAADIVEWKGAGPDSPEYGFVRDVLALTVDRLAGARGCD